MTPRDSPPPNRPAVDANARPRWMRTGYTFFPYAAQQSGQWWVLRFNSGFPEHDMFTLFIDGSPTADITGNPTSQTPLVVSIGSLRLSDPETDEPMLEPDTAATVVRVVSRYVDYGSEFNDPCIFCSADRDGMTRG